MFLGTLSMLFDVFTHTNIATCTQDFISLPQGGQTGSQKCQLLSLCCCWNAISSGHTITWDEASVIDSTHTCIHNVHWRLGTSGNSPTLWIWSMLPPLPSIRLADCTRQPWHQKYVDVAIPAKNTEVNTCFFFCVFFMYVKVVCIVTCYVPLMRAAAW